MNWYGIAKQANSDDDALWREIENAGPSPAGRSNRSMREEEFYRRHNFTSRYGWAVPSREAFGKLKEWIGDRKVIEIGGGRGLWSRLLRGMGVNVEVSDPYAAIENKFLKDRSIDAKDKGSDHTWTEVQRMSGDEHAAMGGAGDVLMMIWPYFESEGEKDWQAEALKRFAGRKFIFVGEHQGGATGTPGLWEELESSWKHVGAIQIPQWDMIRDVVHLYEKK